MALSVTRAYPSNSKWLKAEDLKGREANVVIASVGQEVIGQGNDSSEKLVLYFQGKKKGLALNKTNATAIAAVYGDDAERWAGKSLILFPTSTNFAGKMTPCLRVRVPGNAVPQQQQQAQAEPGEDFGDEANESF